MERPLRKREFSDLWRDGLLSAERVSPVAAELRLRRSSLAAAKDLAARESSCCSFFRFDVTSADDLTVMRIGVPEQHVPVLDSLLASARAAAGLEPA